MEGVESGRGRAEDSMAGRIWSDLCKVNEI